MLNSLVITNTVEYNRAHIERKRLPFWWWSLIHLLLHVGVSCYAVLMVTWLVSFWPCNNTHSVSIKTSRNGCWNVIYVLKNFYFYPGPGVSSHLKSINIHNHLNMFNDLKPTVWLLTFTGWGRGWGGRNRGPQSRRAAEFRSKAAEPPKIRRKPPPSISIPKCLKPWWKRTYLCPTIPIPTPIYHFCRGILNFIENLYSRFWSNGVDMVVEHKLRLACLVYLVNLWHLWHLKIYLPSITPWLGTNYHQFIF